MVHAFIKGHNRVRDFQNLTRGSDFTSGSCEGLCWTSAHPPPHPAGPCPEPPQPSAWLLAPEGARPGHSSCQVVLSSLCLWVPVTVSCPRPLRPGSCHRPRAQHDPLRFSIPCPRFRNSPVLNSPQMTHFACAVCSLRGP